MKAMPKAAREPKAGRSERIFLKPRTTRTMTIQRKFKVTTTVTQHMWASSRADAEKFQHELIRKGRLDLERDGVTNAKFCFGGADEFLEAPEDISQTRDPAEEPRKLDWLEIQHGGVTAYALVQWLTRRKVYYYEALSRTERSVDRERWQRWARQHTVHPSYDGVVPPFIVEEAIEAHEQRGLLHGMNATPDSSLILEILDQYGYVPDDYDLENGYWAETYIDRAISERIMASGEQGAMRSGAGQDDFGGDFSVGFSQDLPTIDEFEQHM